MKGSGGQRVRGGKGKEALGRWPTANPTATPAPPSFSFWLKSWCSTSLSACGFFPPCPPYSHTGLPWGPARGMKRAKLTLFLVRNSYTLPRVYVGIWGWRRDRKEICPFLRTDRKVCPELCPSHFPRLPGFNLQGQCARPRILPHKSLALGPLCLPALQE